MSCFVDQERTHETDEQFRHVRSSGTHEQQHEPFPLGRRDGATHRVRYNPSSTISFAWSSPPRERRWTE